MKYFVSCICVLILHLVACSPALSQQTFERTYGGRFYDSAAEVYQTADHGFIVFGTTRSVSNDTTDAWLVRTDALGDTLWTRSYGGNLWDSGVAFVPGSDGGYLLVLATNSFTGNYDIHLIRIDEQGNTQWTKTYGGPQTDYAHSVTSTDDGGYMIIAHTQSYGMGSLDHYLLKVDQQGDSLWTRTYGGTGSDWGGSVQQTADGGYILAGDTHSFDDPDGDIWVIRTDDVGDTLWTRTFGGSGSDRAYSVIQTDDGGYIVAGQTHALSADHVNGFAMKLDPDGNQDWMTILGGERENFIDHVIRAADGDYVAVGGMTAEGRDDYDAYFVRLDKDGTVLAERLFGGPGHDIASCIRATSDDGFVIVGSTQSFNPGMDYDFYLIKTDADGMVTAVGETAGGPCPHSILLHQNYPNPFHPTTMISYTLTRPMAVSLVITDALGRDVRRAVGDKQLAIGMHSVGFDASGLPSGVYFYRLEAHDAGGWTHGSAFQVRKMLLLR